MIAVIIPSHNRRDRLLTCLARLFESDIRSDYLAIVVLDGCTDGSEEAVRDRFPRVVVATGGGDLWWSGAVNVGLAIASERKARHALLLNDDVVIDPNAMQCLVTTSNAYPGALVGSYIFHATSPEHLWCAGGSVDWWGRGAFMRHSGRKIALGNQIEKADWLPGMGTLIPMETLKVLNGVDAGAFPQYFGDTDLTLRARKAGFKVLVDPRSKLYNDVESTGLLWRGDRASWPELKELLLSLRSHANYRIRIRFWLRHCPKYLIPLQFGRFYGRLLLAFIKAKCFDQLAALRATKTDMDRGH